MVLPDSEQPPAHIKKAATDLETILKSALNSIRWIALILVVNFALSLVALVVIRIFVRVFIYLIITAFVLVALGSMGLLWYNYGLAHGYLNSEETVRSLNGQISKEKEDQIFNETMISREKIVRAYDSIISTVKENEQLESLRNSRYLLAICLVVSLVNVVLLFLIIWTRKSLKLTIKLMEQANHALFSNIGVIVSSVVTSAFQVIVLGCGLVIVAYVMSNVIPVVDSEGFVMYVIDPEYHAAPKLVFVVVAIYWMLFFVVGCQKVILADVFSSWFFKKTTVAGCFHNCFCPTALPMLRFFRFNAGSVAFGSLLISISKLLRMLAFFFSRKLKEKGFVLFERRN